MYNSWTARGRRSVITASRSRRSRSSEIRIWSHWKLMRSARYGSKRSGGSCVGRDAPTRSRLGGDWVRHRLEVEPLRQLVIAHAAPGHDFLALPQRPRQTSREVPKGG